MSAVSGSGHRTALDPSMRRSASGGPRPLPAVGGLQRQASHERHQARVRRVPPSTLLGSCASTRNLAEPDSDAPETRLSGPQTAPAPPTYGLALRQWRTPEDVNSWIGAHFEYDMPRALRLSESQRMRGPSLPVLAPARFFEEPRGVCVDLARFAVETLCEIASDLEANYLMIEFDPVNLGGSVLRRHWVASFKRGGKVSFFADSKRPGHMAGPYVSASEYIAEYSHYRRRRILGFRELPSYQRPAKRRAEKQMREDA